MIFYRVSQGGAPSARRCRPSNPLPFIPFISFLCGGLARIFQHAALDLIEFDRFEQRAEIALAEALIALALDDLEEDRTDHVLREDLQQQLAFRLGAVAVDQDAQAAQVFQTLAVVRQAAVHQLIIRLDGVLEDDAGALHLFDRGVDVVGAERDVLVASPWYSFRYSAICDLSSDDSLIGMRIFPHGEVMAFDFRPVSLPSMSK